MPQVIEQTPTSTTLEALNDASGVDVMTDACRSLWDGGRIDTIFVADVISGRELARRRELVSAETN